jgi:hypothetical protein
MNAILETTNIIDQDGWMPIINGKVRLKQNQLLFVHQLSQAIRKEKGERMGFDTPEKLYDLISYASQSDSLDIKEKLHKVIDSFSPELRNLFTH